jgi:ankyrin repeat protein
MTKKQIDKALLEGCESGDYNKVRLAINFGADLEAKNNYGLTPLHLASRLNHIEIAKLLIDRGADLEAKTNGGWTPLHLASDNNNIETAKLLIERGADVEAKTNGGRTPLRKAQSEEMRDLLKKYMK